MEKFEIIVRLSISIFANLMQSSYPKRHAAQFAMKGGATMYRLLTIKRFLHFTFVERIKGMEIQQRAITVPYVHFISLANQQHSWGFHSSQIPPFSRKHALSQLRSLERYEIITRLSVPILTMLTWSDGWTQPFSWVHPAFPSCLVGKRPQLNFQ